jgi:hypothetical protein
MPLGLVFSTSPRRYLALGYEAFIVFHEPVAARIRACARRSDCVARLRC